MTRFDRHTGFRAVFIAVLVGVILLSTVGSPVSARPPPHAVCGVCSDTLVDAAADNDIAISMAESSLTIEIDESGTGHWTARVSLTGTGVETLRENQSLRDHVVQRVFDRGYVAVEEPQSLTTSMNGSTLTVEYDVPGMAHQSAGGVYVVDFFYWHGGEARWFYLAADSMTMRGPPGTVVSHAPTDAAIADEAVTWEGSDQQYDPLGGRSHVVFAPNNGIISGAATSFGIGVDVAQLKAQDLAAVGVPLVLLTGVVALLGRFGHRLAALSRSRRIALVVGPLVAVGVAAATVETLVGVSGPLFEQLGDFLFYLVYVIAATGAAPALVLGGPLVLGQIVLARRLLNTGTAATEAGTNEAVTRLLLWPTAAVLAGQWLLFPVAAAGAAGYDTTYGLVSLVLPTLYFLPLAVTRQRETPLTIGFIAGLVLAPVPIVFALAPHTGMALVNRSLALLYVPWTLVVAAIGIIAYASGHRLVVIENG
ncbi:hypothetical protein ACERIT_06650 [Halopenitus sp. H-Gu1]|uniref:hypothetical protein n=1 Tax=Halopenitus sp. H-Gu1 TaxID=3242697 RepID=UPI00359E6A18